MALHRVPPPGHFEDHVAVYVSARQRARSRSGSSARGTVTRGRPSPPAAVYPPVNRGVLAVPAIKLRILSSLRISFSCQLCILGLRSITPTTRLNLLKNKNKQKSHKRRFKKMHLFIYLIFAPRASYSSAGRRRANRGLFVSHPLIPPFKLLIPSSTSRQSLSTLVNTLKTPINSQKLRKQIVIYKSHLLAKLSQICSLIRIYWILLLFFNLCLVCRGCFLISCLFLSLKKKGLF